MIEIVPNWHPIFVHFTVALFSLSTALAAVTPFVRSPLREQWHTVTLWLLWFGACFTVLTGLTGLYAYNTVAHDAPSHAAMTEHRNWAVATISLFLVLAVWSFLRVRRGRVLGPVFVIGMMFGGGVLASTAWRGGELVYRYGLGVNSLPRVAEGHVHADDEEEEHAQREHSPEMSEEGIGNTNTVVCADTSSPIVPSGHHDEHPHDHEH